MRSAEAEKERERKREKMDVPLHCCVNQGDANDFITPGNVIHTIS